MLYSSTSSRSSCFPFSFKIKSSLYPVSIISNSYISIYNFDALKYTHLNNDEYYDKIRDTFKNPLKNTKYVMEGFNKCIYKMSIKPEPVAVPESEGDFDDNY